MKKLLSLALALLLLAVMLPVVSMADEITWEGSNNVYWQAGETSGQTATLAEALKAAYMANKGDITITCRPDSDVGSLTHGHVADNITIIGNGAYISGGECDLEVDTYQFNRATGVQDENNGVYLEKNITITASNLYNLGVWGQRHTSYTVNINLTNCDSKAISGMVNVQRVYISGATGVNNITVTGCDFLTKATALYSNADGTVVIDNCTFNGGQVPVNFNHKANGIQTVTVKNSTFTNCGDAGEWSAFAAPVRFVNSGTGSLDATIENNTFTGTVGNNGDILLGDYREGKESHDVTATITPASTGDTTVKNSLGDPKPVTEKVTAKTDGSITPVKEEGSTTIVIISPTQDTPKTDDQKNPTTGANDLVAVAVAAAALALAGSAIILRKD